MTNQETKMTGKPMTLREKVIDDAKQLLEDGFSIETVVGNICLHLEDTGAPAHMRVAKELRGEE